VQQALIAIESAGIGVTVADNARLPQLDLNANIAWFGLRDDFGDSYGDIADGDFVNYVAGLRFSQALGNRAADSTYREARLRRSQAVVAYDRAVQSTVLAVKNALTDCVAYRELAEQNRTFRLAQAENLRALLVDERTLAALTPEFLQLKFQLQNGLALAEDQYFASLVGYQNALAALAEAMGTGLEANQIEFTPATDAGK
jgi:outer membrane protein TolC